MSIIVRGVEGLGKLAEPADDAPACPASLAFGTLGLSTPSVIGPSSLGFGGLGAGDGFLSTPSVTGSLGGPGKFCLMPDSLGVLGLAGEGLEGAGLVDACPDAHLDFFFTFAPSEESSQGDCFLEAVF